MDIVLLSLSVVFLIIGIHQLITLGLAHAYWAIMLSIVLFFVLSYRKRN
jgi:hypothetical protein